MESLAQSARFPTKVQLLPGIKFPLIDSRLPSFMSKLSLNGFAVQALCRTSGNCSFGISYSVPFNSPSSPCLPALLAKLLLSPICASLLCTQVILLWTGESVVGLARVHQGVGREEGVAVSRRGGLFTCRPDVSVNWDSSERVAQVKLNATKAGGAEEQLKILMAAGGTGGHVYPAIAIADEIRRLCGDDVEVKFVGSKDRMESSVVPRAGYEISAIPAVPIRRPFVSFDNLLLPAKLLWALYSSWQLLRQVRPHVVVGTGGYVSGPLCLVAASMGCPVVVQEQNAYAGLTNRLLGNVAEAVFIAFSAAKPYFPKDKCVFYGNPTRVELRQYISAAAARRVFFPREPALKKRAESKNSDPPIKDFKDPFPTISTSTKTRKQVVLILGGSLGARSVNTAAAGMAAAMLEEYPTRHIIWQTGPTYYEEIIAQVCSHPRLAIFPYVNAMRLAYGAADLVVARAGAITCSELLVTGKPSILIPSTNVAEDHQTKNARAMAEQGAAKVLVESSLDSLALAALINELLDDSQMLMAMTQKALQAATPDASNQVAEHVLRLAKHRRSVALT